MGTTGCSPGMMTVTLIRLQYLRCALVLSLAISCLCGASAASEVAPGRLHILVVKTRDIPFYAPALQGFTNGLKARGLGKDRVEFRVVALTGKVSSDDALFATEAANKPALIVTLGTDATRLALKQKVTTPVLFSMVLDPVSIGAVESLEKPGGGFSGSTLLVSPGKQLDALLQYAATARRIGVLFTPGDPTSLSMLAEAEIEAKRLNAAIVPVASPPGQATRDVLASLRGKIDALWLIPDPASSGAKPLEESIAFAHDNRLPVLGSSVAAAQAGALLSLSASVEDLGDVTADMASHILTGAEQPATMRVRGPRRTVLTVNLVTARNIKLNVPPALLHLADEVIDGERDDR